MHDDRCLYISASHLAAKSFSFTEIFSAVKCKSYLVMLYEL